MPRSEKSDKKLPTVKKVDEGSHNLSLFSDDDFDDPDYRYKDFRVDPQNALIYKRNELIFGQVSMSLAAWKVLSVILAGIDSRQHDIPTIRMSKSQLAHAMGKSVQYVGRNVDKVTTELAKQFATLPKIFDSNCISINGFTVRVSGTNSILYLNANDAPLLDRSGRLVKLSESKGLLTEDGYPPDLSDIRDAKGKKITTLGQSVDTPKSTNDLYVDANDNLCNSTLAVGKKAGPGSFEKVTWFERCSFNSDIQMLEFEFGRYIKPYVVDLKRNFTKVQLKYISALDSLHAARLYEVFRSKLTINDEKRGVMERRFDIDLEDLRTLLVLGNKYKLFSNFRKRILDPSRRKLKEVTDIEFDYELPERKEEGSRSKITVIKFIVKSNPSNRSLDESEDFDLLQSDDSYVADDAYKLLVKIMAPNPANNLIKRYGASSCIRNVIFLNSKRRMGFTPRSTEGWLTSAIKFDYARTNGALDVYSYETAEEQDFIRDYVHGAWELWSDEEQAEFVEHRIYKGFGLVEYLKYINDLDDSAGGVTLEALENDGAEKKPDIKSKQRANKKAVEDELNDINSHF